MRHIITFSGLDGAGKSTQIDLLRKYFEARNKSVMVFWSRGGYTPGFIFLKTILRILAFNRLPEAGNSERRDKVIANKYIQRLWLSLALIDLIFYYCLYLRIQSFVCRKIVVCDRFVHDTLIDFKLNFSSFTIEEWKLWKLLKFLAVRPTKQFVALISVEESQKRSTIKGEPFPDSYETLEKRLEHYVECLKTSDAVYINGLENKLDIHNYILEELMVTKA